MAVRGSLYRCHLFSYSVVQTEGVLSRWSQNLEPVGEREIMSGELVELLSELDARHALTVDSGIRFDILEQDHILTGGPDDRIVSLMGNHARQPEEGFETEIRTAVFQQLPDNQTLAQFVDAFKRSHPVDFERYLLSIEDRHQDPIRYTVLTWWRARRLEDYLNSEYYFILNVDDAFEDTTEDILDVTATPRSAATIIGRIINPAGVGIRGASVNIKSSQGVVLANATTSLSGEFRIDTPFQSGLTLEVINGFLLSSQPIALTAQNAVEPLRVPDITMRGLSLTGKSYWPAWKEPPAGVSADHIGEIRDVSNHFIYEPATDNISPAMYTYDRAYYGMPLANVNMVIIRDDPALDPAHVREFHEAVTRNEATFTAAEAVSSNEAASLGEFKFDNSLIAGDFILGAVQGYRLVREVSAGGVLDPAIAVQDNRFLAQPDRLIAFVRVHIDDAGIVTSSGRPWATVLYILPVVEFDDENQRTRLLNSLSNNWLYADVRRLEILIGTTVFIDTSRVAPQFTAEQQDALLKHTALVQRDGRTTFLFDHAIYGYINEIETQKTRLPWVPWDDELLITVHAERRDAMEISDFSRYPLKFLLQGAQPRFQSRVISRERGDDIREVKIRLILWSAPNDFVDPNVPGFDLATEHALIRFKHSYDTDPHPVLPTPLRLAYISNHTDATTTLYPDSIMGRTFSGICDLQTFKGLCTFISDIPIANFALTWFRSPGAGLGNCPEYGTRGVDRILPYALHAIYQRRRGAQLEVRLGVRCWPQHTLDDEHRDLSVNHPGGYAVKVHPLPEPGGMLARIQMIQAIRDDCVRFGACRGKAGPFGLPGNHLPPLPIGLTTDLCENRLLVAPLSWLEQGDQAGEQGTWHHRYGAVAGPPPHPASVQWRVVEDGVEVGVSGNAAWDNNGVGIVRTPGAPISIRNAWAAYNVAVNRWGRYYGVPVEIILGLMGTESRNFNPRSCRVEPIDNSRSQNLRNNRWNALGCTPFPGPGGNVPPAPPGPPNACPGYTAWFNNHNAVRAQVNGAPNNGIIPPPPGGQALVNNIVNMVEQFAPAWVSPGIIQTLVSTARTTLQADFGANANVIVTTPWLLEGYDPQGASNSIRAGAAYVRVLADTQGTNMDPVFISPAYNHGSIARDNRVGANPANPTYLQNRWQHLVNEINGGHTDRYLRYLNDAVFELRQNPIRPNDTFHCYDDVHLDTFMLHHSRWEVQYILGEEMDPADPQNPGRVVPPLPHASQLAYQYSRTNPQPPLPPGAPAVGSPARLQLEQNTLNTLVNFLDNHLYKFATNAGQAWMRLLWTFVQDEPSLKGVRHNHRIILSGRVTNRQTARPIANVRVVLESPRIEVKTNMNGDYVISAPGERFPADVQIQLVVGRFTAQRRSQIRFPGAKEILDLSVTPIEVTGPLVPARGPVGGGAAIVINGSGFVANQTTVMFGERVAQNVVAVGNRITAQTPGQAGSGAVDVIVETPDGKYRIQSGFTYE